MKQNFPPRRNWNKIIPINRLGELRYAINHSGKACLGYGREDKIRTFRKGDGLFMSDSLMIAPFDFANHNKIAAQQFFDYSPESLIPLCAWYETKIK